MSALAPVLAVPPSAEPAEKTLVATLLLPGADLRVLDTLDLTHGGHIYNQQCREALSAIRCVGADPAAVEVELRRLKGRFPADPGPWLAELADSTATVADLTGTLKIISEFRGRRLVLDTADRLRQIAENPSAPVSRCAELAADLAEALEPAQAAGGALEYGIDPCPPPAAPVLGCGGRNVLHEGGLLGVLALPGSLKTQLCQTLSGVIGGGGTAAGFSCPSVRPVWYFDCERHFSATCQGAESVSRRGGRSDSMRFLNLSVMETVRRREYFFDEIAQAAAGTVLIVDNGTDLVVDPDTGREENGEFFDKLIVCCRQKNLAVILTAHKNWGKDFVKGRGFFGSILHRAAETVAVIKTDPTDPDLRIVSFEKVRHDRRPDDLYIKYDPSVSGIVDVAPMSLPAPAAREAAATVLMSLAGRTLTYGTLIDEIAKLRDCGTEAAKKWTSRNLGGYKNTSGTYSFPESIGE